MNYSLVQGLTSGGAASFLHSKLKKQAEEDSKSSWITMALQVNHLLLLSAENLILASAPIGIFGSIVRASPLLTIAATAISVCQKDQTMPFSSNQLNQFNNVYRAGVVAASVATFALGSPVFAIASISMIGVDMIAEGRAKKVFEIVKKITAAVAAFGYGMQIFSSEHFLALSGKISVLVVSSKLVFDELKSAEKPFDTTSIPLEKAIDDIESDSTNTSEPKKTVQSTTTYKPNRSIKTYDITKERKDLTKLSLKRLDLQSNSKPNVLNQDHLNTSKENIFCRKSVW